MGDIAHWLDSLGLGRYADAFAEHEIDWDVLPDLDQAVLKDIGVETAGARLRLLKAIRALQVSEPVHTQARDGRTAVSELTPDLPVHRTAGSAPPLAPLNSVAAPTFSHEEQQAGGDIGVLLSDAERRQLTVMFCDLVDSTALAAAMDLEAYRRLLAAYQQICRRIITEFGGYIARYMGDGLLVYFGYPQAHEDDPERAVRAGLDMLAALQRPLVEGEQLVQMRIGVATGDVVAGDIIGEGASEERAVLGDTPNLAARLQALATPGALVVAPATRRLTGELFEYESLGEHSLKGFEVPVAAWRALGATTKTRFEAARNVRTLPLVGRDGELAVLRDRLERAGSGDGQVVVLSGEPGIGKSRLIHEVLEHVDDGLRISQFQCLAHHTNSPFYPLLEHIRRQADLIPTDSTTTRREKLEAWLGPAGDQETAALGIFARVMSFAELVDSDALALTPQQLKQRTIELLISRLIAAPTEVPALLVFEDVHWSDPTTLEVLNKVIDAIASTPTLLLLTHRPEFDARFGGRGHLTALSLSRLGRRSVVKMLRGLDVASRLSGAVAEDIVEKTDGVPLFVEELTKAMLDDEVSFSPRRGSALSVGVPSTLKDSLIAALDRQGDAKTLAQMASVFGRDFAFPLLLDVAGIGEASLSTALDRLVRADLLVARGTPPHATYQFKHALVQETAYDSLLREDKVRLHGRVVGAIERHSPEVVIEVPEVLAYHCEEAGLYQRAFDYWRRASELALERNAFSERLVNLEAALRLCPHLAADEKPEHRELELLIALGGTLQVAQGYTGLRTRETFARARELAEKLNDTRHQFAALRGLHSAHFTAAEYADALDVARESVRVAERTDEPGQRALAQRLLGQVHFASGDFRVARQAFEAAMRPGEITDAAVASLTGGGHHLMASTFLSHVLWLQGHPDQALALAEETLGLAESHHGPFATITNLYFLCWVYGWRGEFTALTTHATRLKRLAEQHGIVAWTGRGSLLTDWEALCDDDLDARAALALSRLEDVRQFGGVSASLNLGLVAEAIRPLDPRQSLEIANEALELIERGGERTGEAELLRVRAACYAALEDSRAEVQFLSALDVANRQGAYSWSLRIATDLAAWWASLGRSSEALNCLDPVYNGFTEGFETRDLERARRVLVSIRNAL